TYGPDGAQNFLANCRLQLFMAPADSDTPDYVSKAIGDSTRKARSKSWTMGQLGKSNIQEREEGARLLRPEDLRNLSVDDVVLLIQNSYPVLAQKVIYYEDRYLKPLYEDQEGVYPEPQQLVIRAPAQTIPTESPAKLDISDDELHQDDEVSKENFERIKGAQTEMLSRIRTVKEAIAAGEII
ncbi:MAG: type IV secretory system conjugative DNA transfer family protein, partial [Planctomycetaceae bacterium]|nr:type IV secretory system conjugative DNA transfer family protein [Planctomycetaceae bacterium]